MDRNDVARRLIALGKREHALLRQLNRVAEDRCALLQSAAPDAGLSEAVREESVAPKDDAPGGGGN